jgi:hypothetical protein
MVVFNPNGNGCPDAVAVFPLLQYHAMRADRAMGCSIMIVGRPRGVSTGQINLDRLDERGLSMHTESTYAESVNPEWAAFMEKFEAAEAELTQGRPAAFKALWSQSPDVSIYGAFGGVASGCDTVATRLDWAGRQFSEGTRSREEIGCTVSDKLAYLAQIERICYRIPGHAEETTLELRATLVFRREADGWRIVHRHADPLMSTQAPK